MGASNRLRRRRGGSPQVKATPVREPDDWLKLEVLKPDRGVLGEHLRALEMIGQGLDGSVPFLMTVFTPLSIASRLAASEDVFLRHLREHWDKVSHALEIVTETFTGFAAACLDRGASGLFYATTSWATTDRMTADEYNRYARPYDLKLLNALPDCEFHMLHVCRAHNMLSGLRDYPVHAFNWDIRGQGNPSLAEGKAMVGERAVIGGARHGADLAQTPPDELRGETGGMLVAMGKRGWMLGTGCTFPPEAPEENLRAVRDAVDT